VASFIVSQAIGFPLLDKLSTHRHELNLNGQVPEYCMVVLVDCPNPDGDSAVLVIARTSVLQWNDMKM